MSWDKAGGWRRMFYHWWLLIILFGLASVSLAVALADGPIPPHAGEETQG